MKNIKYLILGTISLLAVVSCETDADTVADVNDEAGLLLQVSSSSNSAILGLPESGVDLEDAIVTISNAYLGMNIRMTSGTLDNVEKIEIVKSFNGGPEFPLAETTTLPYDLELADLNTILDGFGLTSDDLRIGDVINLRTKVYQTDGDVYYYNAAMGNSTLVVNCLSDLAGDYSNPLVPDCFQSNPVITVTEDTPGRYYVSSMTGYNWTSGNCIGFYMVDICGELTYDGGDLEDNAYSGEGGFGQVNPDGSFTFTCFLVEAGYSEESTYTPL